MKLITLDNLYEIWYKYKKGTYRDSLWGIQIVLKYNLDEYYDIYDFSKKFSDIYDAFVNSGWKVI